MPSPTGLRLAIASLLLTPAFGALYTDPHKLPKVAYDYVIVGAGNAGNVLANRLSKNPLNTVLVLEAGVSDEGVLAAQVPFLGPSLTPGTPYDWNYTVTPQEGLDGRSFPFPRGRLLGGCTSVNYMVHQFGSSEDYDKLARDVKDPHWKWDNIKKFIYDHERIVPSADGHDTTGQYIPANHGTKGTLPVSLPGSSQGIDARVISASKELSSEFPFNPDMGGGDVLGLGWVQGSIGNGKRSSSATTYLAEAINRPNLHVLINAQVTKVEQTGVTRQGLPSFHAVVFAKGPGVPTTKVWAKKEIILSAGAFGTPQILLLSGIGPKDELKSLGIRTIINNPSVGRNLSDHVLLGNVFNARGNESLDTLLRDPTVFGAALNQWNATLTGPLANGVTNNLGFFRIPKDANIFKKIADPATGPKASHWELVALNFWLNPGVPLPPTGSFLTLMSALIAVTSRGFLKLKSADPFAHPIIDPKFLTTEWDISAMRESVKAVKRFAAASAWKDYIISPYGALATANDDAAIDAYVRTFSSSVYHPVGTAAMTAKGAKWGVVDPDLKLKGAEGIRIVDASVFPQLPNAHTQGPTYLLAEKAASFI